jgi:hypothetical protein
MRGFVELDPLVERLALMLEETPSDVQQIPQLLFGVNGIAGLHEIKHSTASGLVAVLLVDFTRGAGQRMHNGVHRQRSPNVVRQIRSSALSPGLQAAFIMSNASQSRCRFIKVKPSLFHAREMRGLAVYAILFIGVELPNYDAWPARKFMTQLSQSDATRTVAVVHFQQQGG